MKSEMISIERIRENSGNIQGLPANPRKISRKRLEDLKRSISDAPEMLSLRELIVFPTGEMFTVVAGNQRLQACRELGYKELPCKVLDESTPVERLREIAIKDNVHFGSDDLERLAAFAGDEFMKYCSETEQEAELQQVTHRATASRKKTIQPPRRYLLVALDLNASSKELGLVKELEKAGLIMLDEIA